MTNNEENIKMLKENILDWTNKMERLHEEKCVLTRLALAKTEEFKACNAQLIAMHDELKRLEGKDG